MITPDEIAELRRLEAAATKAPWHQGPYYKCDVHSPHQRRDRDYVVRGSSALPCDADDAELIVKARNAIPRLLDALEAKDRHQIDADARIVAQRAEITRLEAEKEVLAARAAKFEHACLDKDAEIERLRRHSAALRSEITGLMHSPGRSND